MARIAELERLRAGLDHILTLCAKSADRGCPVLWSLGE